MTKLHKVFNNNKIWKTFEVIYGNHCLVNNRQNPEKYFLYLLYFCAPINLQQHSLSLMSSGVFVISNLVPKCILMERGNFYTQKKSEQKSLVAIVIPRKKNVHSKDKHSPIPIFRSRWKLIKGILEEEKMS